MAAAGGAAILAVGVVGVWALLGSGGAKTTAAGETARATRDRLVVTITESGEIDAKRSVDIRCEVEGQSTILWVIEEGNLVKKGDKLVELDSADLEETVRAQEMVYKTAKAAFDKADQTVLIQKSTRESLLAVAALDVKFSLLDLKKYLGTELADRLIASQGKVDFEALVADPTLGGEALQKKRKLQTDIDLANEELKRAASKVEWTRKLEKLGYVTGSELEADELAAKRNQVLLDQAGTALDLFLRYEFPKAAEKAYTDWLEFKREYDRVDARTQSELDSDTADRDTKQAALALEERRLKKFQDQLEKTTIRAPQPGMVVYETGHSRFGQAPPMEVGSSVRHQQVLIKLPDLSEMDVNVKLHESVVKQASLGAPAYVTIDAFQKDRLTGKVSKIAVMPDRQNWWLNPGLKVYRTDVALDATPQGLKPGMSAQVEILADTRNDVLQVPISAVHVDKGFQVVYVRTPKGPEVRRIEAGLSNDQAVEMVKGVDEGEEVYLYKPDGAPEIQVSEEEIQAQRAFEEEAAAARAKAEREEPAALPDMPDLKNLDPEQAKAMREKLEKLPKAESDAILKRLRDGGAAGDATDKPDRSPRGEGTGRPDRTRPEGRRQP
ncbi:MAG TPA: HlyD family efflux transporter periplasmic adaptor subunit [Phycisphaerae bacterium]|nr:HlyD family efflux transporter periplasmic adaptor subunit [Phycisphaerae bacterium]